MKKLITACIVGFLVGCSSNLPQVSVTPTPRTWDGPGFIESFSTARQNFTIISIQDPIDWWYLEGKPYITSKAFQDYQWQRTLMGDMNVFIQIDPYPSRAGDVYPGLTFADDDVREAYLQDALQRVELYKPKYLCLAMEINSYYIKHPEDFDNFMICYRYISSEIRVKYPELFIFVSFQYETLVNFGQWELVTKYGNEFDAIGLTTYPKVFNSDVTPKLTADYYTKIREYTPRPLIFAEIGWGTDRTYAGEIDQRTFIQTLFMQTKSANVFLYNYNFLYDAKGFGTEFDTMGLVDATGKPRLALATYLKLR